MPKFISMSLYVLSHMRANMMSVRFLILETPPSEGGPTKTHQTAVEAASVGLSAKVKVEIWYQIF